jgi:hypothetical protein
MLCEPGTYPIRCWNLYASLPLTSSVTKQRSYEMLNLKQVRRIGVAAVLVSIPMLQASAQTDTPASPQPAPPSASPPVTRPDPAVPARPTDKSATAPAKINPLVGLAVFSADGNKMGTVHSVSVGADGKATAIRIRTGGFLGFGAKLVAIPDGRFTKSGNNIQLALTADEVGKLPEVKEQS